jgi:hypothetical protein
LTAFDLIMSVDPHWYSTLFGAYYFIGSFFTGLAFVLIISFIAGRYLGMQDFIQPLQLHNMGKMLLGFCLLTADFFYTPSFSSSGTATSPRKPASFSTACAPYPGSRWPGRC